MQKNILYISYDGMTDPLGQSQVLPYLCGLSQKGYRYTLISCEKPERYEANSAIIEKICTENHIDWQPMIYHKNPPVLSTIWDVISLKRKTYKLYLQKKFDLTHCRGYISSLIGLSLKRKHGVPFLFDMRGFWADEKKDAGVWPLSNPLYKLVFEFFKKKEVDFIKDSAAIISLTHAGKNEMLRWDLDISPEKINVIPCCVDTAHFSAKNMQSEIIQSLKESLNINSSETILSYLGSIGTWYMLDEMLNFFLIWLQIHPNSKLLFITHDEHERIQKAASERNISDKIIIRPGQRHEVPALLALSQVSLFFIRSTYSKMSSSPTKQGEIMAMGIPIICNTGVGDTDTIVKNYNSGVLVSDFNETGYCQAILDFDKKNFEPEILRKGAIDYFDLEKGVESYFKVYHSIEACQKIKV
jgi:glycosyltransferase involved in cell wall biosynthesis